MADGEAFYVSDGDGYASTPYTTGPWSPQHQHAGPPAALLGRALERAVGEGFFISRIAYDIPKPVPVARLDIDVEPATGGRSVRRAAASLRHDGAVVMHARCTAIRRAEVALPDLMALDLAAPGPPDDLAASAFPYFLGDVGYHTAMEVRFASGGFGQRESKAWMRPRVALVRGEAITPLQRVLIASDSGNGVTNVLSTDQFLFLNPDLTVHLHRAPQGDWVCLDAYTTAEAHGSGIAHSRLFDRAGPIGHAVQSLLIAERHEPVNQL
jgi:hypothetical protein